MKYFPQFDSSDCGAACLTMVAAAYGSRWSLAHVRDIAGTDRRGTNLNGMLIAAEALGFESKAMKSEEKLIDPSIPLPCIAHIERTDSSNHLVVIYKTKGSKLWIADSNIAKAKFTVDLSEFSKEWSGNAVFFIPHTGF